jgi:hypothetical protein
MNGIVEMLLSWLMLDVARIKHSSQLGVCSYPVQSHHAPNTLNPDFMNQCIDDYTNACILRVGITSANRC